MRPIEREYQIHRAFTVINSTAENPTTGRRLNDATKRKLFLYFYYLVELQSMESGSWYSDKYGQLIPYKEGDIRKSWEQVALHISGRFEKELSVKTVVRLAKILAAMDLLSVEHEAFAGRRRTHKTAIGFKVIRLKTFSKEELAEADEAFEQLLVTQNTKIYLAHTDANALKEYEEMELAEIESESTILQGVDSTIHPEKRFCPIVENNINIYNNTSVTIGQKFSEEPRLITPALESEWKILVADGGVARDRVSINRSDIPEEVDGEYYATWIGEQAGQYYTPWVIWDIDVEDRSQAHIAQQSAQGLVTSLLSHGVPEEAIRVVFSTRRGFHVYLDSRVIDLKPSQNLHSELKKFCTKLLPSTDQRLYDRNHVIGIPNSLHRATGLYYCPINLEELFSLNIAQLRAHANRPHEFQPQADTVSANEKLCAYFNAGRYEERRGLPSLEEIQSKVAQGHPAWRGTKKGGRDRAIYDLARRYARMGLINEEAFVLCLNANTRNEPRLPEDEVRKKVNSAYKHEGVSIQ